MKQKISISGKLYGVASAATLAERAKDPARWEWIVEQLQAIEDEVGGELFKLAHTKIGGTNGKKQ